MVGEEGKHQELRSLMKQTLYTRRCRLKIISMFLGKKLETVKDEDQNLLDTQVLRVTRLTLLGSVSYNVVKEKTTVNLMKALSGMYENSSANNKVHVMKKVFNLNKAEGNLVAQHMNEFSTITNQLSLMEIEFDVEFRALILLASLLNSWKAITTRKLIYCSRCKKRHYTSALLQHSSGALL